MKQPEKALYTAKVHTTGGRDGASRSSDGRLEVKLSSPGTPGPGTNPEQMFAAGWSACFEGAMGMAARKLKIALPAATAIDAEVDLCKTGGDFFCGLASMLACLAWSAKLPILWWTPRTRLVHLPRPRAATSMSRSMWPSPNQSNRQGDSPVSTIKMSEVMNQESPPFLAQCGY